VPPALPQLDLWSKPCIPHPLRTWAIPEYLLWWVERGPLPVPLAATRPLGEQFEDDAQDGLAATHQTVLGNTHLDYGALSGGRLTAGMWCDTYATVGIEGRGFVLERSTIQAGVASAPNGFPRLGVPFFNVDKGTPDFLEVSTPDQTVGSVNFSSSSQLWGAEGNFLVNLFRDCYCSFDVLAGFRHLNLREDLTITTATAPLPFSDVAFGGNFFNPPNTITTMDQFATRNEFYGGQLGARAGWHFGGLSLDVAGKLAIGDTHEVLDITGNSTLTTGPVSRKTLPGGIFALPSNIGRFIEDDFAVVPEVEVKVGYKLSRHLSVFAGYNFTYWSRVIRPGDQINPTLGLTQIPTANAFGRPGNTTQPTPFFNTTDFWAQGLIAGLEVRY
jgi:hypothetical protein